MNVAAHFENYEHLELIRLEQVRQPKLEWSCRAAQVFVPFNKGGAGDSVKLTEKLIISGQCCYSGTERPFIARLIVTFTQ